MDHIPELLPGYSGKNFSLPLHDESCLFFALLQTGFDECMKRKKIPRRVHTAIRSCQCAIRALLKSVLHFQDSRNLQEYIGKDQSFFHRSSCFKNNHKTDNSVNNQFIIPSGPGTLVFLLWQIGICPNPRILIRIFWMRQNGSAPYYSAIQFSFRISG